MNLLVINKDDLELLINEVSKLKEVVEEMKEPQPKTWVSEAKAMEILNVSKSTIQKFRREGLLPWSQYRNLINYKYSDLMKFFEEYYTGKKNCVIPKLIEV